MKKTTLLLLAAAFLIFLVGLFILSHRQTHPLKGPVPTLDPNWVQPTSKFPTPTPYPEVPQAVITPLIPLLPFENNQFLVEYLPKEAEFYVSIKPGDSQFNYEAAVDWLSQQGVPSPQSNSQVRFIYLESY